MFFFHFLFPSFACWSRANGEEESNGVDRATEGKRELEMSCGLRARRESLEKIIGMETMELKGRISTCTHLSYGHVAK